MYILPLLLGDQKFHFCELEPPLQKATIIKNPNDIAAEIWEDDFFASQKEIHTLTNIPTFILERKRSDVVLFRMLESTNFICKNKMSKDKSLYKDMRLKLEVKGNQVYMTFTYDRGSGKMYVKETIQKAQKALDATNLRIENHKKELILLATPSPKDTHYQIHVTLQDNTDNRIFQTSFAIHLSQADNIYEAVFDFGSEASQIAYKRLSDQDLATRVSLFSVLRERFFDPIFETHQKVEDRYFYQIDSDPKLFRSRFFIQAQGAAYEHNITPLKKPFEDGENTLVKTLSIMNQTDKGHFLLANLKLAEIGDINHFRVKLNKGSVEFNRQLKDEVFRSIINQFLHILLRDIRDHENIFSAQTIDPTKGNKKLRITLLVPNIYSQTQVYNLVSTFQEDANELLQRYNEEYSVNAIEIQAMSESDASFLGLFRNKERLKEIKPNSNYLIIDAGKGTTDMSIVLAGGTKYGEAQPRFASVYRDGFAGAGNALTYAFIETIAALVIGSKKEQIQQFIREIFFFDKTKKLATDPQDRLHFIDLVERLKRRYEQAAYAAMSLADLYQVHAPKRPTDRLLNNPEISLRMLNTLLEAHFDVPGKTIGDYFGIIDQTVNQVVNQIIKIIHSSKETNFESVLLTGRGFLFKPFERRLTARLKTELLGDEGENKVIFYGSTSKTACLYGPYNAREGVHRSANLVGLPILEMGVVESGLSTWAARLLKKPFGNFFGNSMSQRAEDILTDDFYLQGLYADTPLIKGTRLLNNLSSDDGEYNIFFTGKEFIVRTKNDASELSLINKFREVPDTDELLWKSLFPNVNTKGEVYASQVEEQIIETTTQELLKASRKTNHTTTTTTNQPKTGTNKQDIFKPKEDLLRFDDFEIKTNIPPAKNKKEEPVTNTSQAPSPSLETDEPTTIFYPNKQTKSLDETDQSKPNEQSPPSNDEEDDWKDDILDDLLS